METLYRFCWTADEIADGAGSPAQKKAHLAAFRKGLKDAFAGKARDPFFQRFQPVLKEFRMSREPLERILEGVERDLKPIHFRKFEELKAYALQVAGGPGLASMEVFGFRDKAHRDYAEDLGLFLQLTNITRDFLEDLGLKRLYLPEEDFRHFHLDSRRVEEKDPNWKAFVDFQLDRAWSYLEKSRAVLTPAERAELPTAEAIAAVYIRLFHKLRRDPFRILKGRTPLSKWDKGTAVLGAVVKGWLWKDRAV
jgi:phytoene synthase